MKAAVEQREDSQVELTVEAEPQEVERALDRAYHQLVARTSVPGFRKGKAPRAMLERYLGRGALLERALDLLVPELYRQALEEQDIDAVAEPQLEVTGLEPVAFKALVPVQPTVEPGDYHLIRIPPELVAVTEAEVDAALEQLREQTTPWEPVDRPAAWGDLITLDVKGRRDGQEVLREEGIQLRLVQGEEIVVPGFLEHLLGLEKGQRREFSLSYPQDHPTPDLAGREFAFQVKVGQVREKRLPGLDDEFARGVGDGFKTLEELRQHLTRSLKQRAEARERARVAEEALSQAVDGARVQLPPALVEREVDRLLEERKRSGGVEGQLWGVGRSPEEMREELRPLARERVVRALVLSQIASEEGVEVSEGEVDAEVERLAQGAGEALPGKGEAGPRLRQALQSPESRRSLARAILTQKTLVRLAALASGQATSARLGKKGLWVPGQKEAKAPEKDPGLERQPSGLWLPKGSGARKKPGRRARAEDRLPAPRMGGEEGC